MKKKNADRQIHPSIQMLIGLIVDLSEAFKYLVSGEL